MTYWRRSWNRLDELSGFIAASTFVMIQLHSTTPISMVNMAMSMVISLSAGMSP